MACGDYSNHCNKSGYYSNCTGSPYQNSTCYNWTNASECGGNYHVNNVTPCYQNVAHANWADNKNWSNSPACGSTSNWCNFGNSCSWGGNFCNFGNSCSWGGNFGDCDHTNNCTFWNFPGWNDSYCTHSHPNHSDGHYDSYGNYTDHSDSHCMWYDSMPAWADSCYSGHSNSCGWYNTWGDACYYGYPNSCATSWGDACYYGYPNSCYYYADHNNTPPFNNFCNHADTYY